MNKVVGPGMFAVVGVVAACSGGSDEAAEETRAQQEREALVLAQCDFRYDCPLGDTPFAKEIAHRDGGVNGTQYMNRYGDTCRAEHVKLEAGAKASYSKDSVVTEFRWHLEEDRLSFCSAESECIVCKMLDVPPTPGVPGSGSGRCEGIPRSCSSLVPGLCSSVRGCYAGVRVRWNGTTEIECKGYPDSCRGLDEETCSEQGCTWK